jgi:hypothetical protein
MEIESKEKINVISIQNPRYLGRFQEPGWNGTFFLLEIKTSGGRGGGEELCTK